MANDRKSTKTATRVKDVVCGKDVDPGSAMYSSTYDGKTYYFDSDACKKRFDKDPEQYLTAE
ncbi:MAG TPA: YHS domain-containing protein [Candidatus Paceibacterota bacterium]|nr:YHS domain-containing protein [Candidatus Paceibacterota bacterium]